MTKFNRIAWLSAVGAMAVSASAAIRQTGVDVSHYQGSAGVSQSSWNSVKNAGASFTFIKASEGLTGPDDAAMSNNVARADAAGLYTGVYHYAHPENRNNAAGAIAEADHLLSYAGSAIGPGHLRPALDIEGKALNLSVSDLTTWILNFCSEIVAQKGAAATPIIYMSQYNAMYEVDSRLATYDAWLAVPDTGYDKDGPIAYSDYYAHPTGVFNNWAIWQYTFGATNGSLYSDGDVVQSEYHGISDYVVPVPEPIAAVTTVALLLPLQRRRRCLLKMERPADARSGA